VWPSGAWVFIFWGLVVLLSLVIMSYAGWTSIF
jgi:hypothetical protein